MIYVICSSPRSGSSLLAHTLGKMKVGDPDEYLNPALNMHFAHGSAEQFMKPTPAAYIERLRQAYTVSGTFGVKTHYADLAGVPDIFNNMETLFPNAKYISVTRRNMLRQALSAARAAQTMAYKAHDRERGRPRFNFWAVLKHVVRTLREVEGWEAFYASHGIRPLRVVYEDLDDEFENTMQKVINFLGVSGAIPPPPLRKQADATTEEWVSRFMEAFKGNGVVGSAVRVLSKRW